MVDFETKLAAAKGVFENGARVTGPLGWEVGTLEGVVSMSVIGFVRWDLNPTVLIRHDLRTLTKIEVRGGGHAWRALSDLMI